MTDPSATGLNLKALSMQFPALRRGGPAIPALADITLAIPRGQMVAVLGPSGCGKSTLLNILAGFLRPTSGEITLDGRPIVAPGPDRGMVFQQGALFEWLSVRRNVDFGPRMRGEPAQRRDAQTDRLLAMTGLSDFADQPVYALSGGMQQRVALARCLAGEPDLVLMDEPLGALDALTREKMQGLILRLRRETGRTIILITHSVEEALLLGQRLIVMAPRPGRILRDERLPFADAAVDGDLRAIKRRADFAAVREEILSLIWEMEEDIMGQREVLS